MKTIDGKKRFENECPECGSSKIFETDASVYYDYNPAYYECSGCKAIITVGRILVINEVVKNEDN